METEPKHRPAFHGGLMALILLTVTVFLVVAWTVWSRHSRGAPGLPALAQIDHIDIYDVDGGSSVMDANSKGVRRREVPKDVARRAIGSAVWHKGAMRVIGTKLGTLITVDGTAMELSISVHGSAFVLKGHPGHFTLSGEAGTAFAQEVTDWTGTVVAPPLACSTDAGNCLSVQEAERWNLKCQSGCDNVLTMGGKSIINKDQFLKLCYACCMAAATNKTGANGCITAACAAAKIFVGCPTYP